MPKGTHKPNSALRGPSPSAANAGIPDIRGLTVQQRLELMRWCADSLADINSGLLKQEDADYVLARWQRYVEESGRPDGAGYSGAAVK